jgi:polyhydroxyalkanoate synthase
MAASHAMKEFVTETAAQQLDRAVHRWAEPLTGGLSPVSQALALADWLWHLGISPGQGLHLLTLSAQLCADSCNMTGSSTAQASGFEDADPRFRHPAWTRWPFSVHRRAFRNAEQFWQEAAWVPGMTRHHAELSHFFARQWLDMLAPANWLPTNPVVQADAMESQGAHLIQGLQNWLMDASGASSLQASREIEGFKVGRDVAITPGRVVFQNRLIELIRYEPQTDAVHPEPVVIVPSWIMKFYILDLSPHNSMVRYLVSKGHTVYMLSWRNPDESDRDLRMRDYLDLGIFDALRYLGQHQQAVHAVGYCLGGTLLAIAAAALSRAQGLADGAQLATLRSLSLLAAQTDFSQPGELGLFIDESQIRFLKSITEARGFLTGRQMAASFQFLHSRELVWTRRMREYLLGEREQYTDLTAWNADTTRLPTRMYIGYLRTLYLDNRLANSSYEVEGRAVSLADIRVPVFLVGTQRDHISPWRSVYQLHRLCDPEITFVLASGGHNAGIVSEPGHTNRHYQAATRVAHGSWTEPDQWLNETPRHEGSWWPLWHRWLAQHSQARRAATLPEVPHMLGAAPGQYVMQRYRD